MTGDPCFDFLSIQVYYTSRDLHPFFLMSWRHGGLNVGSLPLRAALHSPCAAHDQLVSAGSQGLHSDQNVASSFTAPLRTSAGGACRFMPLLFGLLQSETEALQSGAAEVLTEIVSKRMDAEAKLQLVQQLGLAPVAAAWKNGLPGSADGDLPLRTSRLLAAFCNGKYLRSDASLPAEECG